MDEHKEIVEQLLAFIPASACDKMAQAIIDCNVKLTITKKRKTKLGDYRAPFKDIKYHRISVNGDLNPEMFLLVLIHEMAHLEVHVSHGRKAKAHGEEWKQAYREWYEAYRNDFSRHAQQIIDKHFKNLKATTCNDPELTRELMYKDHDEEVTLLNDLQSGEFFETQGRAFKVLNKRRTRFLCEEIASKKRFLVSGSAQVVRLNE